MEPVASGLEHVDPDDSQSDSDRSFGAQGDGGGGQQLGDIGVEQLRVGGELGESEVDEQDPAVIGQEDVGQPQIPMGDRVGPQDQHVAPHLGDHFVGQSIDGHLVEGATVDRLVGQGDVVATDLGHCQHTRRRDAERPGVVGHERFVLCRSLQRHLGWRVAGSAQPNPADGAKEQVSRPLVAAEGLDEDLCAIGGDASPRLRPAGVDVGRPQIGHFESAPRQAIEEVLAIGLQVRRAEGEGDERPADQAQAHVEEQAEIGGSVGQGEVRGQPEGDRGNDHRPDAARQPAATHDHDGGEPGHDGIGGEESGAVAREALEDGSNRGLEDGHEEGRSRDRQGHPRDQRGVDEAEAPVPPLGQDPHVDAEEPADQAERGHDPGS